MSKIPAIQEKIWDIFHKGCFCTNYPGDFDTHYQGLVAELVNTFESELLNEQERTIAETDFETMRLATQLMWDIDKIEQTDDENKRDCMEAHNHALQRIYNLLSSKHRAELKEGGE